MTCNKPACRALGACVYDDPPCRQDLETGGEPVAALVTTIVAGLAIWAAGYVTWKRSTP